MSERLKGKRAMFSASLPPDLDLEVLRKRFEKKYQVVSESGCWLWTGMTTTEGYGRMRVLGKLRLAHRISFELHKGESAEGLCVCHRCDVPGCVNPDHLWLGTIAENTSDMARKGRWHGEKGNRRNGRAILTENDVRAIRRDDRTVKAIAEEYGVAPTTVIYARSGVTWGHVKND